MVNKKTKIKERILQIAKNKGISYEKFFNEIDSSYSNFKGEQKKTALGSDTIDRIIAKYPDIDLHWLITGEYKSKPEDLNTMVREELAAYTNMGFDLDSESIGYQLKKNGEVIASGFLPTPLLPVAAVAGFGNEAFTVQDKDIKDRYVIPAFKNKTIDFMIEVEGSSMYPKYSSGDIVACTILNNPQYLQWNKVHVVATKEQGIIVKRVHRGDNGSLKMVSDNKSYPPFEVPEDEITGIALVVGVIRLE